MLCLSFANQRPCHSRGQTGLHIVSLLVIKYLSSRVHDVILQVCVPIREYRG
jgi:hypothetical protein